MRFSGMFAVAAVISATLVTPALAKEVTGDALVKIVDGKTLNCKMRGETVSIKFGRFQKGRIQYEAKIGSRKVKAGYKLSKKGKFRHAQSGASRKFDVNNKGVLTITGSGIGKTTCPLK